LYRLLSRNYTFIRSITDLEQEARPVAIGRRHPTSNYYDALFDVSRSSLLPSLSSSSRFSVLKREAARHPHLRVLSRRNPPFLFVNTNASTVGRALLVFSKVKQKKNANLYPALSRPTPAKTVACFFTLIFFNGDVGMGSGSGCPDPE
jgi:hypothetical protein